MVSKLISLALIGVGIIHLLPISGVLGSSKLAALYGIQLTDPDLILLMRHRALLFGILGALLISAAFRTELQIFAVTAGFVSVAGFIGLAWPPNAYHLKLRKVVLADWIALGLLLTAAGGMLFQSRG